MHFKSVWPQFQILIMSPPAFTRLIKTRKNNTKHLAVSNYHNTPQMTFRMSRKHRLWKHAKETHRCVIISRHAFTSCPSVWFNTVQEVEVSDAWIVESQRDTRKGWIWIETYFNMWTQWIFLCIERLCANVVVVSFLCMV